MSPDARKQIRLILDHSSERARSDLEQGVKSLFADHAAKGCLRSGATIKATVRQIDERCSGLISALVDEVSPVAKDIEAFAMIRETISTYLSFAREKAEQAINLAGGKHHANGIKDAVYKTGERLFEEKARMLVLRLEIHRLAFTVPQSEVTSKPELSVSSSGSASTKRGGRLPAEFWDDMWAAIASALYAGDLKPNVQADLERAMTEWIENAGHSAATSTVRLRARKLWAMIEAADN